jgi:pyruvate/2-oxoglutarate dehydrogenase complex dihydrolipoamide dehydrogenase (E3) component
VTDYDVIVVGAGSPDSTVPWHSPQATYVSLLSSVSSSAASARIRPASQLPKTETYARAYAESKGFLILLSDSQHLTGAYALGPEAGEWLQQVTLAIRARVPIEVLRDTIQPLPTFSEIHVEALKALRAEIATARQPVNVGAR